jgi:hypothetical protein
LMSQKWKKSILRSPNNLLKKIRSLISISISMKRKRRYLFNSKKLWKKLKRRLIG